MFSRPRPDAIVTISYAVGVAADGKRRLISPALVANGEVLQAKAVIARAVGQGATTTVALCGEIARRVAAHKSLADVVSIKIVTGTHDSIRYLTGKDTVGSERLHGECTVARTGQEGS